MASTLNSKSSYSYDDFQNALNSSGLAGTFSDADLRLAQSNPDAGMSILAAKQKYNAATTAEAKALANAEAEAVRSSWGGYTGGVDGSGYALQDMSPKDYSSANEAPTYTNQYQNQINDQLGQQLNYGSFTNTNTKPTYTNQYEQQIADLLAKQNNYADYTYDKTRPEYTSRYDEQIQQSLQNLQNPSEFSYDSSTDPLYQQYRKQYIREGRRNTEDVLGQNAAATGGLASSYAVNAAAQAGNYYNAQLTDKIPELYQLAYEKYKDKLQNQRDNLSALQTAEQMDRDMWQAQSNIYDADRNFDYQKYLDNYNRLSNNLQSTSALEQLDYAKYQNDLSQYNTDTDRDYQAWLDRYNMINNNVNTLSTLEQNDYNKYRDQRSDYEWDESFDYNRYLDEVNQQNTEKDRQLSSDQFNKELANDQDQFNKTLELQKKEYELAVKENDYDTAYKVAAAIASANDDTSYLYALKKLLQGN